jgi:hypothetical protein
MKCNRQKKSRCEGLQLAVDKGAIEVPFVFTAKGKPVSFRHGVYIKDGRKKTLFYLNFCPWCRSQLLPSAKEATDYSLSPEKS